MTPHTQLVAELALVLTNAEADAAILRATHSRGAPIQFGTLEDHRTNVLGELLSAIERCVAGMGTRIQAAMYPTTSDEESCSAGY